MVARWCWWLAVAVPATSGWPFAKKRRASSETAATPSGEAVTLSYRAASSAASSASWSKAGYIEAGAPVPVDVAPTLADGLAVPRSAAREPEDAVPESDHSLARRARGVPSP